MRTYKTHILLTGFASLALLLTSCKKYLDINTNPNTPSAVEAGLLLPSIQQQMSDGVMFDDRYAGQYIQNWSFVNANNIWDEMGYAPNSDAGGAIWKMNYYSIGRNLILVQNDALAGHKWNYAGVADLIRAWSWQATTDYHGEIILKDAWKENTYIFNYDKQSDVYAEVLRLCNEGTAFLSRADSGQAKVKLASSDYIYRGNLSQWIKFAYAIKARNLNHQSNKQSYNPNQVIRCVDSSFASNADNAYMHYATTGSADANPLGPTRTNLNSYFTSVFTINLLNGTTLGGTGDPRLPKMIQPYADGLYHGVVPTKGVDTAYKNNKNKQQVRLYGKYVFQDNAPYPILTYWEMQFIKAEAAFRKGDLATAYNAFIKGISAHMVVTGVSAPAQAAYLTSAAVPASATALTMKDIMLQKYISLWGFDAVESWVDLRRHHYNPTVYVGFSPPSGPALYPDNAGKLVYRVRPRYNSEYIWDVQSLTAIGATMPDYHTKEQWFSQAQ